MSHISDFCVLPRTAYITSDEVDPYQKPKELIEVSPKGLVPGLRLDGVQPPRSLNESIVILDFLEEFVFNFDGVSRDRSLSLLG